MKKIISAIVLSIITLTVLIVVMFSMRNPDQKDFTDKELNDYYEENLNNNRDDYLDNLTDEELKDYYENLYGPGDNDLTHDDSFTTSGTTIYNFDEDQTYIEYMRLNYRKAYMIQDTSKKVTYGSDHQGDLVSLLTENGETKFTYGIAIAGANACFTYTDIRQQGYEKFSGYFGAHYLARYTNSTATSFRFRFWCDGVEVLTSSTFKKDTVAEYIEIDLTDVDVFQIEIDVQGSGTGDYIGMGDPKFTKSEATPYLDVFDLEFNLPHQVTSDNILQYAYARNLDGEDISSEITYETNYVKGQTGKFNVTYIIKDIVLGEEVTRRETVVMDVYNIDYSDEWTLEDYKTPYVDYLYHPRQTYSPQMKKLFDLLIDLALDFDDTQWQKKYRSNYYTSQNARNVSLSGAGIYLKYSDVNTVLRGIWDCEPRAFMLLNLDLMGSYYASTNSTSGLTNACWFWAQNLTTEQYNSRVQQILDNSVGILAVAKDDMTYAQKWKYVADNYSSKISYTDGATLYNSIGLFKGKCNGNSQGLVYLAQRLSMQSIYSEGMSTAGFHAWSYQKLPDNSTWYMSDRLWGSVLAKDGNHGHNVYKNRGYDFPTISPTSYNSYNYTYPTIWATFNNNAFIINEGDSIDINGNLKQIGSIFVDILTKYTLNYYVKDENNNTVSNDTSTLSSGKYTIYYIIDYQNDLYDVSRTYQLDLMIIGSKTNYETSQLESGSNQSWGTQVGVYNGTSEERYEGYNINNAGYITINNNNYDSISFKFNATEAVRNNSYATANCKISLSVYFDGVLQTTTATITSHSKYIQVDMFIPEGVSQIKLKINAVNSASAHGCIADIKFGSF